MLKSLFTAIAVMFAALVISNSLTLTRQPAGVCAVSKLTVSAQSPAPVVIDLTWIGAHWQSINRFEVQE